MSIAKCLKSLIPSNAKLLYVEIGVLRATGMVEVFEEFPSFKMIGIDSYQQYVDKLHGYVVGPQLSKLNRHIAEEKIKKLAKPNQIQLMVMDSSLAAGKFIDATVDIVFLDKNFCEETIRQDILDWYPKLKLGAILIGHEANQKSIRETAEKTLGGFGVPKINIINSEFWYAFKN